MHIDIVRVFKNVLPMQTQPTDAQGEKTITINYTHWWVVVVVIFVVVIVVVVLSFCPFLFSMFLLYAVISENNVAVASDFVDVISFF